MKIRPLVIDEQVKAEVKSIIDYAERNYYIPGESARPPGDDPLHVLTTAFGYRCVFSFTQMPNGPLYRDLSISVSTKGKWPNPIAVFMIAEVFGFTGWDQKTLKVPGSWQVDKDIHFDAVRIAQEIK